MNRAMSRAWKMMMLAVAVTGCGTVPDESVRGTKHDVSGLGEFEVEVRYAGGVTREEALALLEDVEIVPAGELFKDVPAAELEAAETAELEPLDDSEPTIDVVLRPMNEAAAAQRFAWRAPVEESEPSQGADAEAGAVATQKQQLSGDVFASSVFLSMGETKRSSRYYCHAFTLQAASVTGGAISCIDLGYEGKADTICIPSTAPVLTHPGPNLNPFDKHYFRGRFTAMFSPAWVVGGSVVCL